MNKNRSPMELAEAVLERSECKVQVGAVLADDFGVFAWGWNNPGPDGLGQHAEQHCLSRANRERLEGATMYVAAKRSKPGRAVSAKPCRQCRPFITCRVVYRDKGYVWREL